MNASESECSSGCESGWTLYLEQSCRSPNASNKRSGFQGNNKSGFCDIKRKKKGMLMEEEEEDHEEEEDLSMVSDASSGPPHFHEEEEEEEERENYAMLHLINNDNKQCFFNTKTHTNGKRQKMKDQCSGHDDQDDTASSPLFNFSNMDFSSLMTNNNNNQGSVESVMDYSQGFSATHFQRKTPAFQDPFRFLQSSMSRSNQPHEIMSGLKGIRRSN